MDIVGENFVYGFDGRADDLAEDLGVSEDRLDGWREARIKLPDAKDENGEEGKAGEGGKHKYSLQHEPRKI